MKNIEVLAPAGSGESLSAALKAGADAVYVGGSKFGARAYAENLTQEQLLAAIDEVHIHERKLYLTVNTLLKEREINLELYEYLAPLYEQGLDAVIVQDIGVLSFIKKNFPKLSIHASTQMTITGVDGAKFLEEQGVERVVTARELSLSEIREIAGHTTLEIESFVHGALCYGYSGQCLFSSLLGGRSGNRGQCAQPCRLPYEAAGMEKGKNYVLSLKDICTLDILPQLLEAGITSLKIEGRMKKPEYVAAVTGMYRKYVDLYLKHGRSRYRVAQEDTNILLDLYNRGGFHEGYYHTQNDAAMVSMQKPNHAGIAALRMTGTKGRTATGTALVDLHKGDILELPHGDTLRKDKEQKSNHYTLGQEVRKGQKLTLNLPHNKEIPSGRILSRTRNEVLLQRLRLDILNHKIQEKVNGILYLSTKSPAVLVLEWKKINVTVYGEKAEPAIKQPLSIEQIEKQLRKTGATSFVFDQLKIESGEPLFMPMQKLNELRRQGLIALESKICEAYRRTLSQEEACSSNGCSDRTDSCKENSRGKNMQTPQLAVYVETEEQAAAVLEVLSEIAQKPAYEAVSSNKAYTQARGVERIYMDCNIIEQSYSNPKFKKWTEQYHVYGVSVYYVMPYIFREETRQKFAAAYPSLRELGFDGMMIRNYESYGFLRQQGYEKPIVIDYNMYTFNHYSKDFWKKEHMERDTASLELNEKELHMLNLSDTELIVYGYLTLMVSAGCVRKTTSGCTHKLGYTKLKDRYAKEFVVKNCCEYCYNMMYNSAPLVLLSQAEEIKKLGVLCVRLHFTLENKAQTVEILRAYEEVFRQGKPLEDVRLQVSEFTKGHFKRGVK